MLIFVLAARRLTDNNKVETMKFKFIVVNQFAQIRSIAITWRNLVFRIWILVRSLSLALSFSVHKISEFIRGNEAQMTVVNIAKFSKIPAPFSSLALTHFMHVLSE